MKNFTKKTLLFFSPIFLVLLFEGFAPISWFTIRPWEGLKYQHSGVSMPFYPNYIIEMESVGDMCHHTKNAIKKNEKWITDKLGYRNDSFVQSPDILIIGDSFVAGSGLTQDSTLTNSLKRKLNKDISIYNIAPASFSDFVLLYENKIIKKPKTIVFSIVERSTPSPISLFNKNVYKSEGVSARLNRMKRLYIIKFIKARILNQHGLGIQGLNESKMFFYQGTNVKDKINEIFEVNQNINSYKKYCDSLGIKFMYIPIPNKETVYFEQVPLKFQPTYLHHLDSLLTSSEISTINTLELFNSHRQKEDNLLYHLDDTHWNSFAIELIANEIIDKMSFD